MLLLNFLLFLIAFLLPASWHHHVLSLMAKRADWWQDFEPAWHQLKQSLPQRMGDEAGQRRLAYHWLTDQLDFYLTLRYGSGWFNRFVDVQGVPIPPASGPALCVTFHYGQGFWALDYLRRHGYASSMIYLPAAHAAPLGEKFGNWLGWRRIRQFERLCGDTGIPSQGSLRKVIKRLTEKRLSVAVMPDVPPVIGQKVLPFELLGRRAGMLYGGLHAAVKAGVPVFLYTMVVNPDTGRRLLTIHGIFEGLDEPELVRRLGAVLDQQLYQEPAAWYLWPWVDAFYEAVLPLEMVDEG